MWDTFENKAEVRWEIWVLPKPNYYTKAGTTEANWGSFDKPEGMMCRNLVPGKDFRIGNIIC